MRAMYQDRASASPVGFSPTLRGTKGVCVCVRVRLLG
jgi:hypothetical protein